MNSVSHPRSAQMRILGPSAVVLAVASAGMHLLAYYMEYMFRYHYRQEPPHIPIFDGHYYDIAWSAFLLGAIAFVFLITCRQHAPFSYAQKVALILLLPTLVDVIRVAIKAYEFS
jgi:hypothetical protein